MDYNHRTHPGGDAGLAALAARLLVAAHPLAPHHVLEVGLPVAEEVDEHCLLHGGEGDLDGSPGEVAGVVRYRRALYLLLGPVRPLVVLLLMPRVAPHRDVELPQDPGEEQGGDAYQQSLHLTSHYKLLGSLKCFYSTYEVLCHLERNTNLIGNLSIFLNLCQCFYLSGKVSLSERENI